jgi:hypothetical protein
MFDRALGRRREAGRFGLSRDGQPACVLALAESRQKVDQSQENTESEGTPVWRRAERTAPRDMSGAE